MTETNIKEKFTVENLEVFYDDFRAIKNVSLAIHENAITSIIGPSGCGKSTFLRIFNRMNDLIPNVTINGDIQKEGQPLSSIDIVDLRKSVGMIFQRPNPFPKTILIILPMAHGTWLEVHPAIGRNC